MMNSRITFVQNYEGAIKLHISELLRKAAAYRNMHETSPVVLRNGEDQFVFAQIQAFDPFQDVSPEEIVHSMQSLGYMDEFMAHATKRHAQLGEEICSDSVFGILPLERWAEDPSMIWAWSIGAWLNVVESVYDFNTATDRIYDMALAELEMPEPTRNQVIVFMRKIQEAQFALMRKIAIIGYDLDHAHFFAERNELYATVSLRNRELDETRNIIIPVNDYDNPETIADTVRAEMAKWDEVCIP